jgi:hypothetical protein
MAQFFCIPKGESIAVEGRVQRTTTFHSVSKKNEFYPFIYGLQTPDFPLSENELFIIWAWSPVQIAL